MLDIVYIALFFTQHLILNILPCHYSSKSHPQWPHKGPLSSVWLSQGYLPFPLHLAVVAAPSVLICEMGTGVL